MVVFENDGAELACKREELPALVLTRRNPGRVLKGRVRVDEARLVTNQMALEDFKVHPIVLERNLENAGVSTAQRVDRTIVRRLFDDDRRTGRHQGPDRQVDGLLRA